MKLRSIYDSVYRASRELFDAIESIHGLGASDKAKYENDLGRVKDLYIDSENVLAALRKIVPIRGCE